MNNDTLDLNQYAALQEGPYQDCTLLRISPSYGADNALEYLELVFNIKSHTISDRVFGNNPRLQSLIQSLMPYVPDGKLNLSAWHNVRCNLKLKNYISGGNEYPQTFDWDWLNPSNENLGTSLHVSPDAVAPSAGDKVFKKMIDDASANTRDGNLGVNVDVEDLK